MKERTFLLSPPHVLLPVESGPLSLGKQLQKFDRRGHGLVIWLASRRAGSVGLHHNLLKAEKMPGIRIEE